MDNCLVNQLLKQVHLGRRVENGFSDQVNIMMIKSGLGWGDKLNKVTAPKELWSEYLKDYPRSKMYRTKMIRFFSSLPIVLVDDKADGRYGVGCDDYNFCKSTASMHGDGISRQDTTSSAIAASIFGIVVTFGNVMEQMTKKRQRVVNNQELMTELKRVEEFTSHDYLEQLNILSNILILQQCS
ncbi:hypothetical protein AMTRI_Chr07g79810 [Amborella trichopoda]